MHLIKNKKIYVKSIDTFTKPIEHFQGECSICLFEYDKNNKIVKLNKCNHIFHKDCINKWIGIKNTCPMCRIYL